MYFTCGTPVEALMTSAKREQNPPCPTTPTSDSVEKQGDREIVKLKHNENSR